MNLSVELASQICKHRFGSSISQVEERAEVFMISLEKAQGRIRKEKEDMEALLTKFGYTYFGPFSEVPEIKFWVKEGAYQLHGRYQCPAPCIDIDDEFFWQYEDEEGNISDKNSGTGADSLSEFLVDNQ